MSELDAFRIHRVEVKTYLGVTGSGTPSYAAPVTVEGFLSAKRHLVRNANAEQVLSESSFTVLDGTDPATFAPKSQVTHTASKDEAGEWAAVTGMQATVITVQTSSGGDVITGLDRVKVHLT